MTVFGLTPNGFVPMRISDITAQTVASLQAALGANLNLVPSAVLGQIIGITAEQQANVWELAEAIVAGQYPAGAEGTSVDNILALRGQKRLGATPTKTAPTSTVGIPGLVAYGTPATIIPAGSIITVDGSPSIQFTTDETMTIANAINAIQTLSSFGGSPTSGTFSLSIVDPSGNTLTTSLIPYNVVDVTTQLTWGTTPTSGNLYLALMQGNVGQLTAAIPYTANAAAVQTAIQALTGYSAVTVTGSFAAGFLINWGSISQPVVSANSTEISFAGTPITGAIVIGLGASNTASITTFTAAAIQAAIQAVSGFNQVTVTGSGSTFFIHWGWTASVSVTVPTNTTGQAATITANITTLNHTTTVINSLQSAFNTLYDSVTNSYPYTDVSVVGSFSSSLFTFTFGGGTLLSGQTSSGSQSQATMAAASDALMNVSTVINLSTATVAVGSPAQATGSATCTVNGPNFVPSGYLTVIGSPTAGWTSVTNPLDCITGTNVETDTDALTRSASLLSSQSNGPLARIVAAIESISGVVSAVGFENVSLAAQQIITFIGTQTAGFFTLGFYGPGGVLQTTGQIPWNATANTQKVSFDFVPSGGYFTLTFGSQTTAHISYTANALTVQNAIQALTGYSTVVVTGSYSLGFILSFGVSSQLPVSATNNLTGVSTITTIPSVQAEINALSSYAPVLVTGTFGNGFAIEFQSSAGGQSQLLAVTTNNLTGISSITVAYGRPGKSFEIVVNDNNGQVSDSLIAQTIEESKSAGIQTYGNVGPTIVEDQFQNLYNIYFSRPSQVPIYVSIVLQTDLTTSLTPLFQSSSISTIQKNIVTIGSQFEIGGLIIGFGSNGLIGAFNNVPGILSYTLYFGTSPNPNSNSNIQLLPEQVAQFETALVIVSFT